MTTQKIVVIGYDELVILMSLLGIEGYIAEEKEQFFKIFDILTKDASIGIILVGLTSSEDISEFLIEYKLNNKRPLVITLPDILNEDLGSFGPIMEKIQDSIGEII